MIAEVVTKQQLHWKPWHFDDHIDNGRSCANLLTMLTAVKTDYERTMIWLQNSHLEQFLILALI